MRLTLNETSRDAGSIKSPAARAGLWLVPWRAIALVAALLAAGYYAYRLNVPPEWLLLAVLVLSLAGLLYLHIVYRATLRTLHRGIQRAQEGTLSAMPVGRAPDRFLHRFSTDYNSLIANLGSTFHEMEECQNRVIGERNRNEAILHSLPGALLCVDGDHCVNLWNHRTEELFGAVLGRNLFDLLALDAAGRELLRDAFLYERPIVNGEILLPIEDDVRHFALNLSFFKSRNLNETGGVLFLEDITEYKHLQEQTYAMEKLAAMGQLAAGVAHELNTPLGNIIGYTRLMEEARQDAAQIARYGQVVSHEARRCARIVDNLLNYARRDRCHTETCELNAIVKEVVETTAECQGRRFDVNVTLGLPPIALRVRGSPGQLDIVLVNLLINAIQAVAGREKPQVAVSVRMHGARQAAILIEDNGPGVAPELQRRIFDPFFTTKGVGKGTGLGLAISQAIITKLGGSVRYDPAFRQGARFAVYLPLAAEESERGG